MKEVVKSLLVKKIVLKRLEPFDISLLKSRKKIILFDGVDTSSNYISVFVIEKKSRFLQKYVKELEELFQRLVTFKGHNYKKKVLIYKMPLCSKAEKLLKELKWILIKLD